MRPPAIGGTFRSTGIQPPPVVLRGWLARRDKESWKRQKGPGRPLRAPSTQRSVPPASWSRSRPRRFSYGGCFSGVGSPLAVSNEAERDVVALPTDTGATGSEAIAHEPAAEAAPE